MPLAATSPAGDHGAARPVPLPFSPAVAAGLVGGWVLLSLGRHLLELWPGGSAWYPPAALVAAACILWGGRAIPPLLLGALITGLSYGHSDESIWRTVLLSAVLKSVYWLGARLLRALRFDPTFAQPADVARFTLVMTLAGLASACCGVGDSVLVGTVPRPQAVRSILVFWVGDLVAVLALTPLLLALAHRRQGATARDRAQRLQALLQVLSVPGTLLLAFVAAPRLGFLAYGICFLPLGWIALTKGVAGASAMSAALVLGAVAARRWSGSLSGDNLELQTFIASLAITGLLLGSVAGQRERAHLLLADSEERYRALVELLPDPLVVHREGRVLFANAAAARTLGAGGPAALHGVSLAALSNGPSRELIQQRLDTLAAGAPVSLAELRLQKLDGSGAVDVEAVSIPIAYDGRLSALTVARDITARNRLAEELRRAQRLESMGRLAGGVAHDFNNLLSVIHTYAELMVAELPESMASQEYARQTLEAARRGSALTRQLLTFSRGQALQLGPVRLDEVVRGAQTLLQRLVPAPARLRFECASAGVILADPGQLEQVLVNLLVNARDAMPEGGEVLVETGTVRIGAQGGRWPGLAPGEYATLFVRDSGTGMSDEVRRHIFDPFFTTKAPGKGTGLGLATVHGIVKQLNGSIFVESTPGAGSLFAIFVPTTQPPAARAGPASRPRVLLVDDNASVRAATRMVLELEGYAVIEAGHGRAALDLLSTAPPVDLVLSDVSMPGMNGHQLVRALRERGVGVPVLLLSGAAEPAPPFAGVRVLQKPLDASGLAAALAEALRPA